MLEVTSSPFISSTRKILTDEENTNQTFPICDMYNVILKKIHLWKLWNVKTMCTEQTEREFCIPDTNDIKWCSDILGRNVIHIMYF